MTITAITSYAKGRYAVYIDNMFAFVLYKGELSNYDLNEGGEIDENKYSTILNEVLIPRAKKRGMNLLMTMDRTEHDVRTKLSEGGYPQEAVDAAIDYLKSFHYIDDYRYAEGYIRYKQSSISRKSIRIKLIQKGISESIIEEAMQAVDEDNASYSDSDETVTSPENALIKRLIVKRTKGNYDLSYEEKQKLLGYMYNKGFPIEKVEYALKELVNDNL